MDEYGQPSKEIQAVLDKTVLEYKEMKNKKLQEAAVPYLRKAIAKESSADKRIDCFEKLLIYDPASITRAEVSRLTYSCQKAAKDQEYLGYMGEKIQYIRQKVLLAPDESLSLGKKLKLILTAIFLLGVLAVIQFTPLGDYLFSQEGLSVMIIGGVVISCIAGIVLMEGFFGFVMGGAIGSIVFSVLIKVVQIGYIPILIVLAILLLRKAFCSSQKMKKKHDEWLAEYKVTEAIDEIRPYVEYIRERAKQIDKTAYDNSILKYYNAAKESLDLYERWK